MARTRFTRAGENALVALLYFVTGKIGIMLALPPGVATAVWPPSGIALAAALVLGRKIWPGIWLGSFLVNIGTLYDASSTAALAGSVSVVSAIALGSTVQALLGAYLLRRFISKGPLFESAAGVFKFVGIELIAAQTAPFFGVTSLCLAAFTPWGQYPETWVTWYLGDLAGILVITPAALAFSGKPVLTRGALRFPESLFFYFALFLVCEMVFGGRFLPGASNLPMAYLVMPFIVMAAFLSGRGGVILTSLLISFVSILESTKGNGPFVDDWPLNQTLLMLQSFVSVITVTGLALAAVLMERNQREEKARKASERLSFLSKVTASLLSTPLHYTARLSELARMIVPEMADWCAVDVLEPDGELKRVAVLHSDAEKIKLVYELAQKYPPDKDAAHGAYHVLRTGEPQLHTEIPDDMLKAAAKNKEHLEIILNLGLKSAIIVPFSARGHVIGALSLVTAESGRRYNEEDLLFAKEIAHRAAAMLDTARLFEVTQDEIKERMHLESQLRKAQTELEERVKERTETLRASEARIRSIVDTANDSIVSADDSGNVISWNDASVAIFGYSREEITGKPLTALMPQRFHEAHLKGFKRFLETREGKIIGTTVELSGQKKDGREFPIEVSLSDWESPQGVFFTAIIRDITERKKIEEELKKREKLHKESQKLAHIGGWEWDVVNNVVTWTDEMYRLYGMAPGECPVNYETFLSLVPHEEREFVDAVIKKAYETHEPFEFDHRAVGKDGVIRWLHAHGDVVPDAAGKVVMMRGTGQDITAQKRAEEGLRQSEERFRSLVQTIPDIVYRLDSDGKIVFINNAIKFLGYAPEELAGRHFHVLIHPEDVQTASRARALPPLKGKVTGDKKAPKLFDERRTGRRATRNLEVRLIPKNTAGDPMVGSVFACGEIISIGQFDKEIIVREKKFLGTVGIIRDVTERKRVENAMRESEAMLRSLYEFAPDAILTVNRKGAIERVNRQLEAMFLYSREDLLGKPVELLLPERFRRGHASYREQYDEKPLRRVMGAGIELYGRRSDGSEFPVDIMLSPIGEGGNQMVIAIVRDITDRKRAEEQLRENEQRFRQLAENIQDVFWLYDRDSGNVIYVSPAFESIWKLPAETVYGDPKGWMKSVHGEDAAAVSAEFNAPFERRRDLEYRIVWPDGIVRWIWDRTFPIKNEAGLNYRVVRITHDVTDKKFMLDALAKSHHEATLGRLAGIVAHQVNNPLAAMKAGISLLKEDVSDKPQNVEKLKVVSDQVDRISRTVRTLLGFVRQRSVKHAAVNVHDVIKSVVGLFEGSLRSRGIHLEVTVMESIPYIRVNADDLQEILVSLLENAREALDSGQCVFVSARAGLTGIELCVEDNGPGLGDSPERLFQPFHTTKTTGTGLGLTIVRRLCESYGGNIVAENKPESQGGGARFKIYLPWNQEG